MPPFAWDDNWSTSGAPGNWYLHWPELQSESWIDPETGFSNADISRFPLLAKRTK